MTSGPSVRYPRNALWVGAIATAAWGIAGRFDPSNAFASWLVAWLFFVAIAVGALANAMIHELTGGAWGFAIRRPLDAAAGTLPVLALLAVPIAFGIRELYPWAEPDRLAGNDVLAHKVWYLNASFFGTRALIYFLVWIALSAALRRYWRQRAANAMPPSDARMRALSIAGLIGYALTASLAAVDWIMSLSADWYSTAFGMLIMVSQSMAAFAFAVACAVIAADLPELVENVAQTAQDLGNILLTYIMLWAYLAFTQFLIIWAEDLPHEIGWYLARSQQNWRWLAIVVFAMQFAIPFAAMLFRKMKRDPRRLAWLCVLALTAQALAITWMVVPSITGRTFWWPLTGTSATLAVGGIWFSTFLRLYIRAPLLSAPLPARPPVTKHG